MKQFLARFLRHFRMLRFDFLSEHKPSLPGRSSLELGRLTLVENRGIKKWACFKCPGGCGSDINLSLNPNQRPHWSASEDFWTRPTIKPSVHQKNECACHFWIKKGQVIWCKDGGPRTNLRPVGSSIKRE